MSTSEPDTHWGLPRDEWPHSPIVFCQARRNGWEVWGQVEAVPGTTGPGPNLALLHPSLTRKEANEIAALIAKKVGGSFAP